MWMDRRKEGKEMKTCSGIFIPGLLTFPALHLGSTGSCHALTMFFMSVVSTWTDTSELAEPTFVCCLGKALQNNCSHLVLGLFCLVSAV